MTDGGRRTTLLAISLACLGSIGAFKGFPLLARSPIDLTLILLALVVGLVLITPQGHVERAARRRILGLWALFIPGVIVSIALAVPSTKWLYLFTVTLVAALGGASLRLTHLKVLAAAQVALATSMAALTFVFPESTVEQDYGRSVLEGGTSISASRVVGAGIVVIFVVIASRPRGRVIAAMLPLATVLLITMLSIGSRGPFIATILACATVLLFGNLGPSRRLVMLGASAVVAVVGISLLGASNVRALNRILSVFASRTDDGRWWLGDIAWQSISTNPIGLGWGGYGQEVASVVSAPHLNIYPHNLGLELLVEDGWIPGGLALAWVIALVWRVAKLRGTGATALVFPLLTYWLMNAAFSSDINGNRELWLMVGVSAALSAKEVVTSVPKMSRSRLLARPHRALPARGRTHAPTRRAQYLPSLHNGRIGGQRDSRPYKEPS